MSGRAIILIVVGIIIISGVVLYRIEAASTSIVANSGGYFKKQSARNIAQTGVNLALRQLGGNSTWRSGFSGLAMLNGTSDVKVFDTTYAGITTAIGIRSTGKVQDSVATSTVFCYFPQPFLPLVVKALLTLRANNQVNGNITIDGRDHEAFDPNTVIAGSGTYGVWSTGVAFAQGGASQIGGTVIGVDMAPARPALAGTIQTGQVYPGGFPTTPDSALGGVSSSFPPGTLKSIAKSGVEGSQYVTDPSKLRYPLSGVTYVEPPAGSNIWDAANINGSGILVMHNAAGNATIKNTSGAFAGILLTDDLVHMHADFWGAIVVMTTSPAGNVFGNGNSRNYFSRHTILKVMGLLSNGTGLNVIAWWE